MDMFEICGITEADFVRLFAQHKTCGRVAKVLGVTRETVQRHGKRLGLTVAPHRPKRVGRPKVVSGYGRVVSWLRAEPGRKLPRRVADAALKIGVSKATVYSFIKYRQAEFSKYLKTFPRLDSINVMLQDVKGRAVPTRLLGDATVRFKLLTMEVIIEATLGDAATVRIIMPLAAYERLFKIN
jgi:hypothetical protein